VRSAGTFAASSIRTKPPISISYAMLAAMTGNSSSGRQVVSPRGRGSRDDSEEELAGAVGEAGGTAQSTRDVSCEVEVTLERRQGWIVNRALLRGR
jgi:hypothetical protein